MRQFFVLSLLFCACSGSPSVPKDVLQPEKMQEVLYDVIRADEMVDLLRLSDSTYYQFSKRTALYDTVFQLHKVKKEAFQKSMKYYQGRPDLLKQMFDHLQTNSIDTSRIIKRPNAE